MEKFNFWFLKIIRTFRIVQTNAKRIMKSIMRMATMTLTVLGQYFFSSSKKLREDFLKNGKHIQNQVKTTKQRFRKKLQKSARKKFELTFTELLYAGLLSPNLSLSFAKTFNDSAKIFIFQNLSN